MVLERLWSGLGIRFNKVGCHNQIAGGSLQQNTDNRRARIYYPFHPLAGHTDRASPFQAQGEVSPGKNALLPHTTAGFTPLPVGHESFAVFGPLALVGSALYPVSVRRPMGYLPRFLQTVGHPSALALPFGPCGQVPGGLAPPGVRPCRAHKKNAPFAGRFSSLLRGSISNDRRHRRPRSVPSLR